MNIYVLQSEQIAKFVADLVAQQLNRKPDSVLAVTTGNTPLSTGIYKEWIRRDKVGEVSFNKAVFINPDEFLGIHQDHPESYYRYMKKNLFDHIQYQQDQWYIPDGMATDPQAECDRMEETVYQAGGIDWQLMGIGVNGHFCFIEPDSAIPAASYVTPIAEVNRQMYAKDFGSLNKVPTHAITFGLGTVIKSRALCLVAVGETKAEMIAKAILEPVTTELPASILQLHPDVTIVLDESAATKLRLRKSDLISNNT